jgi:DNA-binding NarL/FixJ family response regulator
MQIKLAIVEDDPRFRAAFAGAIAAADDMTLVAAADDLPAGLALLEGEAVDVMLVDLGLPSGSGVELIRQVAVRWPDCDVIVVSIFGDEAHVVTDRHNRATDDRHIGASLNRL